MSLDNPILVTGAAGSNGGVGRTVVELLRQRNLPVRLSFEEGSLTLAAQTQEAASHLMRQIHRGKRFSGARRAIEEKAPLDVTPGCLQSLIQLGKANRLSLDAAQHSLRQNDVVALNLWQMVEMDIERALMARY